MAELDLKLPNLRQGASAEENINEIYSYLKKQNEKLKYILNNLDVDSFNEDAKIQLKTAIQLAETNSEVISTRDQLEQLIKNTADEIIVDMETRTTELSGSIEHISNTFGTTVEELAGKITESPNGLALANDVNTLVSTMFGINGQDENAHDYEGAGYTYTYKGNIQLGYDTETKKESVTISGSSSDDPEVLKTIIDTDSLSFHKLVNGRDVLLAYFGSDEMYINTVRTHAVKFAKKDDAKYFYFTSKTETVNGDTVTTFKLKYDAITEDEIEEETGA